MESKHLQNLLAIVGAQKLKTYHLLLTVFPDPVCAMPTMLNPESAMGHP